jgi:hypothetical protein
VPDSAVSVGVRWAQRMIAIGFEFALPPLAGSWLDGRWRTGSLWTIVGAVFGFLAGMMHLLRIAREAPKATPSSTQGPDPGGTTRNRSKSDESKESG